MSHGRPKDELDKPFLSKEYQKLALQKISKEIDTLLKIPASTTTTVEVKETSYSNSPPFFTDNFTRLEAAIEAKKGIQEIIKVGLEELASLKNAAIAIIDKYEGEDNSVLLAYCSKISALTQAIHAQLELRKLTASDEDKLNINKCIENLKLINTFATEQYKYYKNAIDIRIYEVVIPKSEAEIARDYDTRVEEDNDDEEDDNDSKKTKEAEEAIAEKEQLLEAIQSSKKTYKGLTRPESSFGRFTSSHTTTAFKTNIPAKWIKEYFSIDSDTTKYKPLSKVPNPDFKDMPHTRILYALDARDPQKVLETGFLPLPPSLNPHGHIIACELYTDAYLLKEVRGNGILFDPKGGWRINHPWTDAERKEFQNIVNTLFDEATNKKLPMPIVNIIIAYTPFSIFSQKENKAALPKLDADPKAKSSRYL